METLYQTAGSAPAAVGGTRREDRRNRPIADIRTYQELPRFPLCVAVQICRKQCATGNSSGERRR